MHVIQRKQNGWLNSRRKVNFENVSSNVVNIMITYKLIKSNCRLYNLNEKWQNIYHAAKKNCSIKRMFVDSSHDN